MLHPIRALQRLAFKFFSGHYETETWLKQQAIKRHPSGEGVA